MRLEMIIEELLMNNVIESKPIACHSLKGGTASEVYLLEFTDKKLVVKLNEAEVIKSETDFLKFYHDIEMLPDLLFVEPSYKYMVYTFIEGTTEYSKDNKKEWLQALVKNFLNHYKPASKDLAWGWIDNPANSWQKFQIDELSFAMKYIGENLPDEDHQFISQLVKNSSFESEQYLLHGDCGAHNFIFREKQLTGVIDPTPVIGDPLYDLIYAFCSTPDNLSEGTINAAVEVLHHSEKISQQDVYEQVLISLYIRIETCLVHHPHDFPEYLKAWEYWKDLVKSS